MVSDDDHGDGVDPNGNDVELVNSFQTGNDPAEFARFDRWASDHLGVVSASSSRPPEVRVALVSGPPRRRAAAAHP